MFQSQRNAPSQNTARTTCTELYRPQWTLPSTQLKALPECLNHLSPADRAKSRRSHSANCPVLTASTAGRETSSAALLTVYFRTAACPKCNIRSRDVCLMYFVSLSVVHSLASWSDATQEPVELSRHCHRKTAESTFCLRRGLGFFFSPRHLCRPRPCQMRCWGGGSTPASNVP